MREEIQKEINKKPVTIPLYAEPAVMGETSFEVSNNSITINAGDNAQIALNSQNVHQEQTIRDDGDDFEAVKDVLRDIMTKLDNLALPAEDDQELRESIRETITEIDSPTPDMGKIRGLLRLIKRIIAPIGTSMINGLASDAGDLVRQWLEQISQFM